MSSHVSWMPVLDLQPGREATFRALMNEMVTATKNEEPGALDCEGSLSADGQRCHLFERYADSAAAMVHLGNFMAEYAERFMAILTPVSFTIYGAPDATVKEALAGFAPTYVTPVAGFHR